MILTDFRGFNIILENKNYLTLKAFLLKLPFTYKSLDKSSKNKKYKFQASILEIEIELKKSKKQLRKNLATLNYLSNLESSSSAIIDSIEVSDILNLKEIYKVK
jgi:hypothetical protein